MNFSTLVAGLCSALLLQGAIASQAQQKLTGDKAVTADQLKELSDQVAVQQDLLNLLLEANPPTFAWMDCTDRNFREVRLAGSALSIFVSCDTVEPYLEGHKVKLRVGNPFSFDFSGLKGTLYLGQDRNEALKASRTAPISTTQTLRSGSWLPLEISINPSKASEFRAIGVTLSIETVISSK